MPRAKIDEASRLLQRAVSKLDDEKPAAAWQCLRDADRRLGEVLELVATGVATRHAISYAIARALQAISLASNLASALDARSRKALRTQLHSLASELSTLKDSIGPLKHPPFVFDPAGFDVIAHVAATALFAQPAYELARSPHHWGSGIYALYYTGSLGFYAPIRGIDTPIYVGSAAPRRHNADDPEWQGQSLFQRIAEHRSSVEEVESHASGNLKVADFNYRFLVVTSGWELAAEQYLIRYFKPVWNRETKICTGIGKHGDAAKTRGNRRSLWDTVHAGRRWTLSSETRESKKTPVDIQQSIEKHFRLHPPRQLDIKDILVSPDKGPVL